MKVFFSAWALSISALLVPLPASDGFNGFNLKKVSLEKFLVPPSKDSSLSPNHKGSEDPTARTKAALREAENALAQIVEKGKKDVSTKEGSANLIDADHLVSDDGDINDIITKLALGQMTAEEFELEMRFRENQEESVETESKEQTAVSKLDAKNVEINEQPVQIESDERIQEIQQQAEAFEALQLDLNPNSEVQDFEVPLDDTKSPESAQKNTEISSTSYFADLASPPKKKEISPTSYVEDLIAPPVDPEPKQIDPEPSPSHLKQRKTISGSYLDNLSEPTDAFQLDAMETTENADTSDAALSFSKSAEPAPVQSTTEKPISGSYIDNLPTPTDALPPPMQDSIEEVPQELTSEVFKSNFEVEVKAEKEEKVEEVEKAVNSPDIEADLKKPKRETSKKRKQFHDIQDHAAAAVIEGASAFQNFFGDATHKFEEVISNTVEDLKTEITSSVQEKIDATAFEVKQLPKRVTNAATDAALSAVDEITTAPRRAVYETQKAIVDSVETAKLEVSYNVEETVKAVENKVDNVVNYPSHKINEAKAILEADIQRKEEEMRKKEENRALEQAMKMKEAERAAKLKELDELKESSKEVPVISDWSQNADGSISGYIKGSSFFEAGKQIRTSPLRGRAQTRSVVETTSGSRYFLEPLYEVRKVDEEAKKKRAEEERKQREIAAVERKEAIAEAKRLKAVAAAAAEEKRLKALAEKKARAEAKRQEEMKKKLEKQKKRAEMKAKEDARLEAIRQKARPKVESKELPVETDVETKAKSGKTISLFGLFEESPSRASPFPNLGWPTPKPQRGLKKAPKGIPTIFDWTSSPDGSVSGFIKGSPSYVDGEAIITSPINEDLVGGSVVETISGSRYFLEPLVDSEVEASVSSRADEARKKWDAEKAKREQEAETRRLKAVAEAEKKKADVEARRLRAAEAREKAAAAAELKRQQAILEREARHREEAIAAELRWQNAAKERRAKVEAKHNMSGAKLANQASAREDVHVEPKPPKPEHTSSFFGLFGSDKGSSSTTKEEIEEKVFEPTIEHVSPLHTLFGSGKDSTITKGKKTEIAPVKHKMEQKSPFNAFFGSSKDSTVVQENIAENVPIQQKEEYEAPFISPLRSLMRSKQKVQTGLDVAPKGIPTLSNWKTVRNGSIFGYVSGSPSYADGQSIMTSKIRGEIAEGTIVETIGGSRYYLQKLTDNEVESRADKAKRKREEEAWKRKKAIEEKRVKAALEAEARRQVAAEKAAKEKERKAHEAAKRQEAMKAEALRQKQKVSKPYFLQKEPRAPKGVPTFYKWKQHRDGSISGIVTGSPDFEDGDTILTSPITSEAIEGTVVETSAGERFFLSDYKSISTKQVKPGGIRSFSDKKSLADISVKDAPKGIPFLVRWKKNRDGSITGLISGSPNFEDGQRITTSPIVIGTLESGEIVETGTGSQYFLF